MKKIWGRFFLKHFVKRTSFSQQTSWLLGFLIVILEKASEKMDAPVITKAAVILVEFTIFIEWYNKGLLIKVSPKSRWAMIKDF